MYFQLCNHAYCILVEDFHCRSMQVGTFIVKSLGLRTRHDFLQATNLNIIIKVWNICFSLFPWSIFNQIHSPSVRYNGQLVGRLWLLGAVVLPEWCQPEHRRRIQSLNQNKFLQKRRCDDEPSCRCDGSALIFYKRVGNPRPCRRYEICNM